MNEISLVYVTFPDRAAAEAMARAMIEQRLAACANVLGEGSSFYCWEGAMETVGEALAIFKTAPDRRDALIAAIERAHAYDLPAIISWPAQTTATNAAWVRAQTRPTPDV